MPRVIKFNSGSFALSDFDSLSSNGKLITRISSISSGDGGGGSGGPESLLVTSW